MTLPTQRPTAPATPHLVHGAAPVELLDRFERFSFRTMQLLAHRARPATEWWLRGVGKSWMWQMVDRTLVVHGLERLAGVRPDQGLLLVANHRSYFDLYTAGVILDRKTELHQPVFCPVRADFFYERPLGMLVNLVVGGGRMYPPVFRDPHKADFNKWALGEMVDTLQRGNVLIGFHPEGTRNKNADPYQPLPAQPGVGKLVMETWPVILPVFVLGLTNNLAAVLRSNLSGRKTIVAVFGEPVELAPFRAMSNRLASHKRIADKLLEIVYQLGQEERQIRAKLEP